MVDAVDYLEATIISLINQNNHYSDNHEIAGRLMAIDDAMINFIPRYVHARNKADKR